MVISNMLDWGQFWVYIGGLGIATLIAILGTVGEMKHHQRNFIESRPNRNWLERQ